MIVGKGNLSSSDGVGFLFFLFLWCGGLSHQVTPLASSAAHTHGILQVTRQETRVKMEEEEETKPLNINGEDPMLSTHEIGIISTLESNKSSRQLFILVLFLSIYFCGTTFAWMLTNLRLIELFEVIFHCFLLF